MEAKTVSVVFDTNILFSATGWRGTPYRCVQSASAGRCRSVTCLEILKEFQEKLNLKLKMETAQTEHATSEILSFSRLIPLIEFPRVIEADPDDDAVLACAVQGKAKFLVSGDKHLLDLETYNGVEIVRAQEFLKQLELIEAS